jgi:hypothetical protein
MSALGHKRTSTSAPPMSAFGRKADTQFGQLSLERLSIAKRLARGLSRDLVSESLVQAMLNVTQNVTQDRISKSHSLLISS